MFKITIMLQCTNYRLKNYRKVSFIWLFCEFIVLSIRYPQGCSESGDSGDRAFPIEMLFRIAKK